MDPKLLSLFAAIFGLLGGTILAVSLNRVLSEVRFAIDALSTSIESVVRGGDIYVFKGLDERVKEANHISGSWVRGGIYCLAASTVLAALSVYA